MNPPAPEPPRSGAAPPHDAPRASGTTATAVEVPPVVVRMAAIARGAIAAVAKPPVVHGATACGRTREPLAGNHAARP
ncbi:hypothetical protein [Streptomyces hesseae]|uniref:Uncharacterized protein n=1 Tax=Streptomyces hesseae TaxID=3075519 RepID=A0ABU2SGP3_9ACTN|nr:hypothetical protein [Streptomyces sp. DSM 40473]MDT0448149.1 hypothetical protein [Streptomyces sp. DSM 40473]